MSATPGAPAYLFFDTETNAVGRMSRPVTQVLMQLAWVVTDGAGVELSSRNRFVKGATEVGGRAPHDITVSYVEEHGASPSSVLAEFMSDVESVLEQDGALVAHNIRFDVGVLEHAGLEFSPEMHAACVCTMSHPSVVAHCTLRDKRGHSKRPRLVELYRVLFNEEPAEVLHDALGDTRVLCACFHELLKLGVVSFRRPAPCVVDVSEDLVGRDDCDAFVNASDVATLMGLLRRYKKAPYLVAERVLKNYGERLGVSGVGCETSLTSAEREFGPALKRARAAGGKCGDTAVLKKMERDMHAAVDARGDITSVVAEEAKRLIGERLAQSFGVSQESVAVSRLNIRNSNDKMFYLRCTRVGGVLWGIAGRVDGFKDGHLVEIKTRKTRAFQRVPDYERVQVEIYMRMTNLGSAQLVENVVGSEATETVCHDLFRDDELWADIIRECETFMSRLKRLVSCADEWKRWEGGDPDARSALWEGGLV